MRDCRVPKFSVVHFRMLAKSTSAAAPRRTRHPRSAMMALSGASGDDVLREVVQIGLQLFDIGELLEVPSLQGPDTGASRCPQGFQLARILRIALLHEPQPIAQHFAGILVAARLDEGLEELCLTICQHNISGGHWGRPKMFDVPMAYYAIRVVASTRSVAGGSGNRE